MGAGQVKSDSLLEKAKRTQKTEKTEKAHKCLPTLYDLVLISQSSGREQINYHAVQFVETFDRECNFIHLTDLHLARRNDEILDEVLSVKAERSPSEIKEKYVNFNNNFRNFVGEANKKWKTGELDFVVITGDIVDFAFCGWEPSANEAENNWKTFIEIALEDPRSPRGDECPGIRVAIFTSTGNHDWRKWPYNPSLLNYPEIYGLKKNELRNYSFRSFDALRHGKEREKLEEQMFQDLSKTYNRAALKDIPGFQSWYRKIIDWWHELLQSPPTLAALTFGGGWLLKYVGAVLPLIGKLLLDWLARRTIRFVVDFPLYADSIALQYYLKHINPYLDYGFKWGAHSFIVMDSGSDVFTGEFLDEKDASNIKKMSVVQHILGGSPDSRGFDSAHLYYNWSQIVWLEKVLPALHPPKQLNPPKKKSEGRRTFIFVHAPPLNVEDSIQSVMKLLWESSRRSTKWIPRSECDLTYGTLNHYVSQFLYMCLGFRESDGYCNVQEKSEKVDIVFSGHAHRNIEFRGKIESEGTDVCQDEIRIYCDKYNELFSAQSKGNQRDWWEEHKPFFVQTAACGLAGLDETCPPYFRMVHLDKVGNVTTFEIRNLRDGRVTFPELDQ